MGLRSRGFALQHRNVGIEPECPDRCSQNEEPGRDIVRMITGSQKKDVNRHRTRTLPDFAWCTALLLLQTSLFRGLGITAGYAADMIRLGALRCSRPEVRMTLRWRKADSNSRSHLTGQCQKRDGIAVWGPAAARALACCSSRNSPRRLYKLRTHICSRD